MADFTHFDTRGYRTVDVRSGYGEWVATYEETVEDAMDIELLESLEQRALVGARRPTSAAAPAAPALAARAGRRGRSTASTSRPRCSRSRAGAACTAGWSRPT